MDTQKLAHPYKIGAVAKVLNTSVHTIRLYEREGIVLTHKNNAGTRYFNDLDIKWLVTIKQLIGDGVSIEGIRRLLALLPCWNMLACGYPKNGESCPAMTDSQRPCWSTSSNRCGKSKIECRDCKVYDKRFMVLDLKKGLEIKLKDADLN